MKNRDEMANWRFELKFGTVHLSIPWNIAPDEVQDLSDWFAIVERWIKRHVVDEDEKPPLGNGGTGLDSSSRCGSQIIPPSGAGATP